MRIWNILDPRDERPTRVLADNPLMALGLAVDGRAEELQRLSWEPLGGGRYEASDASGARFLVAEHKPRRQTGPGPSRGLKALRKHDPSSAAPSGFEERFDLPGGLQQP